MNKTIIERMSNIADKMRVVDNTSKISLGMIKYASADIKALTEVLEMTPVQVILLTAIVRRASRYRIEASDVASSLNMDYLKFLTYNDDLEVLRKRGYIRQDKDGDIIVPKSVMNSLKNNHPVDPLPTTGLDADALLFRIKRSLAIREEDQCTTDEMVEELDFLMEQNPGNSISRGITKRWEFLSVRERAVLYGMIFRYFFHEDDRIYWHDLEDYFEEEELASLKHRYKREGLILQKKDIIEYVLEDGIASKDCFHIKDDVKDDILADLGGVRQTTSKISAARKLEAAGIVRKELFYNPAEGRQVEQLRELMSEARFNEIRSKMKDKGLRTGFTCLFYGSPGTGKTETVYQIARESGRDLFIVDVAQIKSCWVGESEKNIKDVFDKYKATVNAGGTTPILLFNEADAIFGIRQEGAERAVDKMENSIQNIILQEMEDLDGILIATTNLTSNLDKAFERRFLYKIRFDKPSIEARVAIWRSMLPELSEGEAVQLATDFDFSGGQIENIARKRAVKSIIGLEEPSFADVREFCREEGIGNSPARKIGF